MKYNKQHLIQVQYFKIFDCYNVLTLKNKLYPNQNMRILPL